MILRVALAQINTTVGDLVGNRDKILAWMDRAREMKANIVAFPEMAITGYPPEDLLLKPDFVEAAVRTLHEIVSACGQMTTCTTRQPCCTMANYWGFTASNICPIMACLMRIATFGQGNSGWSFPAMGYFSV
jgi:hypothetical protein